MENCEKKSEIITLNDEEGKPVKVEILASLYLDDKEYVIATEVDSCGCGHDHSDCGHDHEEVEIIIFEVNQDGEEYVFESLDDPDTIDAVLEAFDELMEDSEN